LSSEVDETAMIDLMYFFSGVNYVPVWTKNMKVGLMMAYPQHQSVKKIIRVYTDEFIKKPDDIDNEDLAKPDIFRGESYGKTLYEELHRQNRPIMGIHFERYGWIFNTHVPMLVWWPETMIVFIDGVKWLCDEISNGKYMICMDSNCNATDFIDGDGEPSDRYKFLLDSNYRHKKPYPTWKPMSEGKILIDKRDYDDGLLTTDCVDNFGFRFWGNLDQILMTPKHPFIRFGIFTFSKSSHEMPNAEQGSDHLPVYLAP
jgi:hypothetical protein